MIFIDVEISSHDTSYTMGILRDVRNVGHWGTGDSEVTIKNAKDFEKIKYLLVMCYNEN